MKISIHASHTGDDIIKITPYRKTHIFQSTPPIRETTHFKHSSNNAVIISIHASHTGDDALGDSRLVCRVDISIHASHTGDDNLGESICLSSISISIHASHTGDDSLFVPSVPTAMPFQSTPPIRETTVILTAQLISLAISIHASHTGDDSKVRADKTVYDISIHASHTGDDNVCRLCSSFGKTNFNPRLPYGRRHALI